MDCSKIDELLMKHMDNILTKEETIILNTHLETCSHCREDFEIYDKINKEFSKIEIINAPDDFEINVMAKINELPDESLKCSNRLETLTCWLWSSFSVLVGIAVMIVLNKNFIMNYLSSSNQFSGFYDLLSPVEDYVIEFSNNFVSIISSYITNISEYVSSARVVLLGILAILGVIQYIIYKRNKVEV